MLSLGLGLGMLSGGCQESAQRHGDASAYLQAVPVQGRSFAVIVDGTGSFARQWGDITFSVFHMMVHSPEEYRFAILRTGRTPIAAWPGLAENTPKLQQCAARFLESVYFSGYHDYVAAMRLAYETGADTVIFVGDDIALDPTVRDIINTRWTEHGQRFYMLWASDSTAIPDHAANEVTGNAGGKVIVPHTDNPTTGRQGHQPAPSSGRQ